MKWIFLSPHLDDAALSCGGMIHQLAADGQIVEIWTVCAGDPPPGQLSPLAQILHERWQTAGNAPEIRRTEDAAACEVLGADPVYFDIAECIYRFRPDNGQPLIGSNDELFQPLPDIEKPLASQVTRMLAQHLDGESRLVSPLAVGGHIDHHQVRTAAEGLDLPLYYYPDYPYIASGSQNQSSLIQPGWQPVQFSISDADFVAWQTAVAAYRTQLSTFWISLDDMKSALKDYRNQGGGSQLWCSQSSPE